MTNPGTLLAGWLLLVATILAGYATHIVWTIKLLMAATEPSVNQILLMILGVVIPFVGAIHGFILWF